MKILKYISLLILCLNLIACQNIIDEITGNSSTNTEQAKYIIKAKHIQEVYWLCVDNPEAIQTNKPIWIKKYGLEETESGIILYQNMIEGEATKIISESNADYNALTEKEKAEIKQLIQKFTSKKE